jgi:hypothetical protein
MGFQGAALCAIILSVQCSALTVSSNSQQQIQVHSQVPSFEETSQPQAQTVPQATTPLKTSQAVDEAVATQDYRYHPQDPENHTTDLKGGFSLGNEKVFLFQVMKNHLANWDLRGARR